MSDLPPRPASSDERLDYGRQVLDDVDGEAGQRVIESLRDIAPDLGRHIIEYGFGDVYSRPGSTRTSPAGLARAGRRGTDPQRRLLRVPRALNAVFVARSVFEERDLLPIT